MPNARSPRRREPTRSPRPHGRSPRRWSFPPSSAGRVPVPLHCEWRANDRNRPSWRSPPGNRPADASRWYGACTASSQRTRTISTTWWNAPAGSLALMASPMWASASSSSPASRSARPAPPTVCVLLSSGRRRATRSRSSRPVIFRCAQPGPKLDIAALDLFAQLFDQLGNPLQVRMDRQRAAECIKRVLLVAHLLQDDAEPRQRAEVARFACQHLVDVGERAAELLLCVVNGRAAVPCLGEIRPDIDDGVEQPNGKVEFLLVGRGFGTAHQQIGGIAARREPDRPDAILDVFRALIIRRDLERREQPVEIMRLVAMLGTRPPSALPPAIRRIAASWTKTNAAPRNDKDGSSSGPPPGTQSRRGAGPSALARLEPALDLVDYVDPALAPDQAIAAVAAAKRFEGVADFHWLRL